MLELRTGEVDVGEPRLDEPHAARVRVREIGTLEQHQLELLAEELRGRLRRLELIGQIRRLGGDWCFRRHDRKCRTLPRIAA